MAEEKVEKKATTKKTPTEKTTTAKTAVKKATTAKTAVKKTTTAKTAVKKTTTKNSTVSVTLVKSFNGRLPLHRATIAGLGLKRINHTVELQDTAEVRGMINKVSYLLRVDG